MTIQVRIRNEDSRANAVVEVVSTDEYKPRNQDEVFPIQRHTVSQAILRGGESKTVYVTSTMSLEIIERQNG
jgi:hypothetical protein